MQRFGYGIGNCVLCFLLGVFGLVCFSLGRDCSLNCRVFVSDTFFVWAFFLMDGLVRGESYLGSATSF